MKLVEDVFALKIAEERKSESTRQYSEIRKELKLEDKKSNTGFDQKDQL